MAHGSSRSSSSHSRSSRTTGSSQSSTRSNSRTRSGSSSSSHRRAPTSSRDTYSDMNRKMDAFEKQLRATSWRTSTLEKQVEQYYMYKNRRAYTNSEQIAPLDVAIEDLFNRILSSIERKN